MPVETASKADLAHVGPVIQPVPNIHPWASSLHYSSFPTGWMQVEAGAGGPLCGPGLPARIPVTGKRREYGMMCF